MIFDINYSLIQSALTFYQNLSYQYISLPWTASLFAINHTKPPYKKNFKIKDDEFLVGSGEQSFIQLLLEGSLVPGRYVGITPCFRDDKRDDSHHNYFMKVELINVFNSISVPRNLRETVRIVDGITQDALSFFNTFNHSSVGYDIQITYPKKEHFQQDIITKRHKIEIGSYGVRYKNNVPWFIYGTGLAEPRFSYAIKTEQKGTT